jgi:O-antigen ligase
MKLSYYHKALIVAAVGIFFTNASQYLYYQHGIPNLGSPKNWVLAFCLLSLPVLVRQLTEGNVLKSPVLMWCLGYVGLSALWFFQSSQSDMTWQDVRWRFLATISVLMFLMVLWGPGAVRFARRALVGAVLLGVAVNIYELFAPMTFSTVMGRSAGLYENPNLAGEALVVGMILSVTALQRRYQVPFILLTGVGVFLTLSRAGIGAWLIAVAGIAMVERFRPKDFLLSGFVGFLLIVLFLIPRWDQLLTTWDRSGAMSGDVVERLTWFTDPFGVPDGSSWERTYVARRAWDQIADHPFWGSGTGSSLEAYIAPHNQYLSLMLDHGLIGALILPLLILAVTWGARGDIGRVALVFGFAVLVLSLFSDAILYREASLLLFSLMAAMAGASGDRVNAKTAPVETKEAVTVQTLVRV